MHVTSIASRNRTELLFFLVAVLLGVGYVAIKVGLGFIPPLLFVAFRLDVAAVLLLAYVVFRADYWRPRTRKDLLGVATGGAFFIFAPLALLFTGLQETSSGVAAIIFSLDPVLTVAIAAVLLADERLSRLGLLGVAVALVGVGIVVQPSPGHFLSDNLEGEEYVLFGAASLALGGVLVRRSNHGMPEIVLTAWAIALAAPAMHLASLGVGESLASVDPTPTALAALLYVGVFMTAVGYPIYVTLIDSIGATRASFVQYVVPVVASVAGWLVLGERLPPEALVGFLVIFVGFILLNAEEVGTVVRRFRPSAEPGGSSDEPDVTARSR